MERVSCLHPLHRVSVWARCRMLVFGGLVWLASTHAAFDLDIRVCGNTAGATAGSAIPEFTSVINEDNIADSFDLNPAIVDSASNIPLTHPGAPRMASYSHIVVHEDNETMRPYAIREIPKPII